MHHNAHLISFYLLSTALLYQTSCKGRWTEIEPMYPAQSWDVTDFTLSFRWKHQPMLIANHKQRVWASSWWLSWLFKTWNRRRQKIPWHTYRDDRWVLKRWSQVSYIPYELLDPGTYHWRVRLKGTQNWSETTSFSIDDDRTAGPMIQDLSPSSPLFSFMCFMTEMRVW